MNAVVATPKPLARSLRPAVGWRGRLACRALSFLAAVFTLGMLLPLESFVRWAEISATVGVALEGVLLLSPWFAWHVVRLLHRRPSTKRRHRSAILAARRDSLFRAFAWMAALSLGWLSSNIVTSLLTRYLLGSPVEALPAVAGTLTGIAVFLVSGVALHACPTVLARRRLDGLIDETHADAVLGLGAGWTLATALFGLFAMSQGREIAEASLAQIGGGVSALSSAYVAGAIATLVYGLLLSRIGPPAEAPRGLWVVALVDPKTLPFAALGFLSTRWRLGPVTLVLPTEVDFETEHARIARSQGQLGALFPDVEGKVGKWQRTLPPESQWTSLTVRELHLPRPLALGAVAHNVRSNEAVIVLTDRDEELPAWRRRLHGATLALGWLGKKAIPMAQSADATIAARLDGPTSTVRDSCHELLSRLQAGLPLSDGTKATSRPETPVLPEQTDVFLSFASEDEAMAKQITQAIIESGHTVFSSEAKSSPDVTYDVRLEQALDNAKLFVFLISPASVSPRSHTLGELRIAAKRWPRPEQGVLPILVESTPSTSFPAYLDDADVLTPLVDTAAETSTAVMKFFRRKDTQRRMLYLARGLAGAMITLVIGIAFAHSPWQPRVRYQLTTADYAAEATLLSGPLPDLLGANDLLGAVAGDNLASGINSPEQATRIELRFSSNAVENRSGADLVIFEGGQPQQFEVEINGQSNRYVPKPLNMERGGRAINAAEIDLTDFGLDQGERIHRVIWRPTEDLGADLVGAAALHSISIFGIVSSLRSELRNLGPTEERLEDLWNYFSFNERDTTSLEEAKLMISFLKPDRTGQRDEYSVFGIIDDRWEVTVWINSYDNPSEYGVRHGSPDGAYWAENETYQRIIKLGNGRVLFEQPRELRKLGKFAREKSRQAAAE